MAPPSLPLESLAFEEMAQGGRSLLLTRAVRWGRFPRYARGLIRALEGRLISRIDTPYERLWAVELDGRSFHLVCEDFNLGISLEPQDDAAADALEALHARLAALRDPAGER